MGANQTNKPGGARAGADSSSGRIAMRLGDLLVSQGLVTSVQVEQALELQRQFGGKLGTNLEEMGFLTGEQLAKCLSAQLGLPYCSSDAVAELAPELIRRVPAEIAGRYRCVPLGAAGPALRLGVSDHGVLEAIDTLRAAIGAELQPVLMTELALSYALERYYGIRREIRGLKLGGVVGAYRWLSHATQVLSSCSSASEIVSHLPRLLSDHFGIHAVHVVSLRDDDPEALEEGPTASQAPSPEVLEKLRTNDRPVSLPDRVWCAVRDGQKWHAAIALVDYKPSYGDLELIQALLETAAACIGQVQAKEELARGERLTKQLRRYVPERVANELSRDEDLVLYGRKHDITVMFADIRGFTSLSERLDPDLTVQILNIYFGEMSSAIETLGGTIDKFIGDGLMAFWGAPKPVASPELQAVQAALDMQQRMPRVNRKIHRLGVDLEQPLVVGIGITTGAALVGNIGTARLMQYTAVGDIVNVASRLCSLAAGGEVLVDDPTAACLPPMIARQSKGALKVKGRDHSVQVTRVLVPAVP